MCDYPAHILDMYNDLHLSEHLDAYDPNTYEQMQIMLDIECLNYEMDNYGGSNEEYRYDQLHEQWAKAYQTAA